MRNDENKIPTKVNTANTGPNSSNNGSKKKTRLRFFATIIAKKIIILKTTPKSEKIQKTSSGFANLSVDD